MKNLRVVGGSARGRRLVSPKGDVRPTADRTKEALFNVLGARAIDATVLDLYSGSGALGIEALSRGANHAVFVDRDRAAIHAINTNVEAIGFTDSARVVQATVRSYLARGPHDRGTGGAGVDGRFDLVFIDPPYDTPDAEVTRVLEALAAPGWLTGDAAVVVERPKAGAPPSLPASWSTEFERSYGSTLLLIANP